MVSQNKTKLSIKIGSSYGTRRSFAKAVRELLVIDPKDEEQAYAFSNKYLLIPRDLRNGFLKGFYREYKEVINIANKFYSGTLNIKEKNRLNKYLKSINLQFTTFNKEQMLKMNLALGEDTNIAVMQPAVNAYFKTKTIKGNWRVFYEELITQLSSKQKVRRCYMCSKLFLIIPRGKHQKFCGDTCRSKFNKRKTRKKLKDLATNVHAVVS